MNIPEHKNPTTTDRRATAPYNFVSVPDVIVPAQPLPTRDRYHDKRHTGVFHCTLTTETPLYTRSALEEDEYGRIQSKDKPDFFYVDPATKKPVIPGSSLRGVLRTLVEIVSYSKLQPVTKKQLFFRTVDDTSVGKTYNTRTRDKIHGGIFRTDGNVHWIEPCWVGRIPYKNGQQYRLFEENVINAGRPIQQTPRWELQHSAVWVNLNKNARNDAARFWPVDGFDQTPVKGWEQGILVITGKAPGKKAEFVFVLDDAGIDEPVLEAMLNRFHDDDQITQWQENAFPVDQPTGAHRQKKGWLRDGEPVFYLKEGGRLTFIGRAAKFRLPYANSPRDLLPEKRDLYEEAEFKNMMLPDIVDMAEAIFGRVDESAQVDAQIAGRVYVGDAHVAGDFASGSWAAPANGYLPHILSSPKPTSIQLYLTQESDVKKNLRHYENKGKTTLRGYKLYWHKHSPLPDEAWATNEGATSQHTGRIRPVRAGVQFEFTLRFENLSDEELGLMLWVMQLASHESFRLKLGLGKPYGLGSVKIIFGLEVEDRRTRYEKPFSTEGWKIPKKDVKENVLMQSFEHLVLRTLGPDRRGKAKCISDLPRIRELLALLKWQGPGLDETQYMDDLRQDFASRKVLPPATSLYVGQIPPILEPPSDTASTEQLEWRAAKVRGYQPQRGGKVIDLETKDSFWFRPTDIVTKGYSPGKKHTVKYALSVDIDGNRTIYVRKWRTS